MRIAAPARITWRPFSGAQSQASAARRDQSSKVDEVGCRPAEVEDPDIVALAQQGQIVLPIVNCFRIGGGIAPLGIPSEGGHCIREFSESCGSAWLAPFQEIGYVVQWRQVTLESVFQNL